MNFLSCPPRLQPHAPSIIGTVLLGITFAFFALWPINHDTAWFMYAARGMLHGGKLYVDYVDVNAPMAYLTLFPAALLSELPLVSNEAALAFNILLFVLAAYIGCAALIKRMNLLPGKENFLLASTLVAMCFLEFYTFGQREHIFGVLIVPYALCAGIRSQKKPLPFWLLVYCGLLAGLAVSIKLPNLLVPVVIEGAMMLRQRKLLPPITADMVTLGVSAAVLYALCFLAWPEYWTDIVPSAVALYSPYNNINFVVSALTYIIPAFLLALMAGKYRGNSPLAMTRWTLTAGILGTLALFVIQQKGWPHHAVPILIFIMMLACWNLVDLKRNLKNAFRFAVIAISLYIPVFLGVTGGWVEPKMTTDIEDRIKNTDGSFYIMSTGNYPAFPLALNHNYHWTSRFPQLIMLPGLVDLEKQGKTSPYEGPFREAILEDLKRGNPATVFLYVLPDAGLWGYFDMLAWLRRDPAFDKEWENYEPQGEMIPFFVFTRKTVQ